MGGWAVWVGELCENGGVLGCQPEALLGRTQLLLQEKRWRQRSGWGIRQRVWAGRPHQIDGACWGLVELSWLWPLRAPPH